MVGGLLDHWACWTRPAVQLLNQCRRVCEKSNAIPRALLARAIEITDCSAAFFDAANGFKGCIAGIHEVLVRQGLMTGRWRLEPAEDLSRAQLDEINRVYAAYPHLNDDEFVQQYRDAWLA